MKYCGFYTEEEIIIGALEDAIVDLEKHIKEWARHGFDPLQSDLDLLNARKEVLKKLQEN